ncbi:ATP-binding protein [Lentibacillus sp. CBA3610]|uniref:ATP-binding protein n=1 Tax=Lentibacillus sp. CBA3610 TaxID=2518176 RepID=UPI00159512CF|nr:hypothetical protein Len3610_11945 [Lentibacillus sp. CBA3610]
MRSISSILLVTNKRKEHWKFAAAGGHNVLMTGPPGCGKGLLAETFPSILPLPE